MKTALVTVCRTVETWPHAESSVPPPTDALQTVCKRGEGFQVVLCVRSVGRTHAHLAESAASGFCLARNSWS